MTIQKYLSEMAAMRAQCAQQFSGEYPEQFILRRGMGFSEWRAPFRDMPTGECYSNAAGYADTHSLLYAEGYASGVIPLPHAWCVDPATGVVIDPTWWQHEWHHKPGHAPQYFGVLLRSADLWKHVANTGYFGIFESGNYDSIVQLLRGEITLPFITPNKFPWSAQHE